MPIFLNRKVYKEQILSHTNSYFNQRNIINDINYVQNKSANNNDTIQFN
jgi:hypothetical protein